MSDVNEAAILLAANVTSGRFGLLASVAEACSWLAQGPEWTNVKSFDIAVAISDFFNRPEIGNASEAAPQLAEYLGTTEERAQYMMTFLEQKAKLPLQDGVELIRAVIPLAGHPANNSELFVGMFVLLTVILAAFVGLRFYSRMTVTGFIRAHDWIIIFASVITLGFGAMNAACLSGPTHYRAKWDRSWKEALIFDDSGKATEVLYPVGIFFTKTSLLVFYWSLTAWWPLRASTIAVFIVCLGNTLGMILTAALRCNGSDDRTSTAYFTASCNTAMWAKGEEICGSINIATDIIIWLIPLPMVWKITQGTRERFLASLTFGVGALACIACGLRFSQVQEYRTRSLIPRDQSRWLLWAMVEMYLAIICSCVPAIRALVIKKAPSLIGTTTDDSENYDKSGEKSSINGKPVSIVNVDSASV